MATLCQQHAGRITDQDQEEALQLCRGPLHVWMADVDRVGGMRTKCAPCRGRTTVPVCVHGRSFGDMFQQRLLAPVHVLGGGDKFARDNLKRDNFGKGKFWHLKES